MHEGDVLRWTKLVLMVGRFSSVGIDWLMFYFLFQVAIIVNET